MNFVNNKIKLSIVEHMGIIYILTFSLNEIVRIAVYTKWMQSGIFDSVLTRRTYRTTFLGCQSGSDVLFMLNLQDMIFHFFKLILVAFGDLWTIVY
jgi:hypothetical protein